MKSLRQPTSVHEHAAEPKLVTIPGGWFWMGSEAGQENERPLHRVWVDGFRLAECPVTNEQYAAFVLGAGTERAPLADDFHFNHPRQPVVGISWFEAEQYCEWLSGVRGEVYRLPSEAEWERAARGGVEGKLFPWGDAPLTWLPDGAERWKNGPELVKSFAPGGFGLYDMCQNVHEWCGDWFEADYYAGSPERNPRGPETGERRGSRGGFGWEGEV